MRFVAYLKRLLWGSLALALLAVLVLVARGHPQDMPWAPLDLAAPIGTFTGRKLTALGTDPATCRALLDRAGIVRHRVPPVVGAGLCGYRDGEAIDAGGSRTIAWRPAGLAARCAVSASLAVWEWEVVQPAAIARFGVPVRAIDHFGAYSCRRIAGAGERSWSEHATGNAIDVAGFRLADGRRITVARDWRGGGAKAGFLHDVRDGACRLFATTLSPDFNAAHHDHLHLDQAMRGTMGWRACR